MSAGWAATLFVASLIAAWTVAYRVFGDFLFWVVSSTRHTAAERVVYRLVGVDAEAEQTAGVYARSILAFSAVSILAVRAAAPAGAPVAGGRAAGRGATCRVEHRGQLRDEHELQAYSGESTMTHLTQMAGLAVQNFLSAAVGIAVAVAVIRGLARSGTNLLGKFWVDVTRLVLRVLLPLGTSGGGFYNVNSAHPFENSTTWPLSAMLRAGRRFDRDGRRPNKPAKRPAPVTVGGRNQQRSCCTYVARDMERGPRKGL